MIALYRACPYPSTKPLPIEMDKMTLVKACLNSFLSTGVTNIIFLLDGFSPEDQKIFTPYGKIIDCTGMGNVGTFQKQIELAKQEPKAFFVEDDYLWRANTYHLLEEAVDYLDFVSPYDHPGHYLEDRFDKHYETKLIGNTVYREAPSNTLTFATTKRVLDRTWPKMIGYGIADHEMFQDFRQMGLRIWNPTYSFATHMVKDLVAPNVEWQIANQVTS